jgi:putative glutamine amidotransferase
MSKRVLLLYRDQKRVAPYRDALLAVGLEPAVTPAGSSVSMQGCDGLLLTGGIDVDPALYGEPKQPETDTPDPELDAAEILVIAEALHRDLPTLGICRGLQILNVQHGGTLIQHLVPPERHRTVKNGDRSLPVHSVEIREDTLLGSIAGTTNIWHVNSRHHQAVKTLGHGLRVSAVDPEDGVIEAVERPEMRFVLAVQWHPEDQVRRDSAQLDLFCRFAAALDS